MADPKGDGILTRLADRRKVVPASICQGCSRAGFHAKGCRLAANVESAEPEASR